MSVWCVKANANQLLVSVVPSLNDSLLQHNSELTAYIGRLSAERQDLRVSIAELQHKLSALPPAADTHAEQVFLLISLLLFSLSIP